MGHHVHGTHYALKIKLMKRLGSVKHALNHVKNYRKILILSRENFVRRKVVAVHQRSKTAHQKSQKYLKITCIPNYIYAKIPPLKGNRSPVANNSEFVPVFSLLMYVLIMYYFNVRYFRRKKISRFRGFCEKPRN